MTLNGKGIMHAHESRGQYSEFQDLICIIGHL